MNAVVWDRRTDRGGFAPRGMYVVSLESAGTRIARLFEVAE
jgi:hypothetical protein